MSKLLIRHFTLEEPTFSQTAACKGINNTPDAAVVRNLKRLTLALEEIRTLLGELTIRITRELFCPDLKMTLKLLI